MKVEYRDGYSSFQPYEETELADVIRPVLDSRDYYAGEIEVLRSNVDALKSTVTALLEILFEQKKLSGNDMCKILGRPKGSIKRIKTED